MFGCVAGKTDKRNPWKRIALIASFGLTACAGNAIAATVQLNGAGFVALYDDSQMSNLFGTPTLSGDGKTILFSPLSFLAQSTGDQGTVITQSNVQIDIIPDAGRRLSGISLIENGDYLLTDRNIGGLNVAPVANVTGELRLTNLQTGVDFVTNNFSSGDLPVINASEPDQWTISETLSTPLGWGSTRIRVRLQDRLTAESFETGDYAFVQKKHASQTVGLTPAFVPLPPSVWLLGSGLIGMAGISRRHKVP